MPSDRAEQDHASSAARSLDITRLSYATLESYPKTQKHINPQSIPDTIVFDALRCLKSISTFWISADCCASLCALSSIGQCSTRSWRNPRQITTQKKTNWFRKVTVADTKRAGALLHISNFPTLGYSVVWYQIIWNDIKNKNTYRFWISYESRG